MKRYLLFLVLLSVLLNGCAKMTEQKRAREASELYAKAMQAYREKDYEDAAWNFKEALKFMDYLTPKQIENARFLMGKSYYLDKDYVNAVVALEDYIFYYPKLNRTEEAYYMLIDSYIKVSPDPYRDQEYTWKAIDKAKEFLSKFPKSYFAPQVQTLIDEAYRKIAQHEFYIAKFYEEYRYTYSASVRYKELLINFAGYISESEVAYRYIKCLLNVDSQLNMEKDKLNEILDNLKDKLEDTKEEDVKLAINRRIEFIRSEIKRWEEIGRRSKEEARRALERYREVYGETRYYKELEELFRKRYGKVKNDKRAS